MVSRLRIGPDGSVVQKRCSSGSPVDQPVRPVDQHAHGTYAMRADPF